MTNQNAFLVYPDSELGALINLIVSRTGLGKGQFMLTLFLKTYEQEARQFFVDTYHVDLYDQLMAKYGKTTLQLKQERLRREQRHQESPDNV
jgi:hypothetical protein